MKTLIAGSNGRANVEPARGGTVLDWQRWTPYAAVGWSLVYAALGIYWAMSGRGFPYTFETVSDVMAPLLARFGPDVAWIVVVLAGIPAALLGAALLRGVRSRGLRPLLITAGALLAGVLLLLMTGLDLLVKFGYLPYAVLSLFTGAEIGQVIRASWTQWATIHQLLCLIGGFLWLAATVSYTRRSGDACLYCGRRDGSDAWTSPDRAARWGRIAVYVALVAPIFYALTRYAWALGIPLGMSDEYLRRGQESGTWISGLFLATFGLVGAILMLGLVQRWGEVVPRWLIGLAGRRVPIALAVVPASIVSVLLVVGGIGIWSGLDQMVANLVTAGGKDVGLADGIIFHVGPTLLFPVWGVALAVATLGYYYRRRGPCSACGRGPSGQPISETGQSMSTYASPSKSDRATTKEDSLTTIQAFTRRHPVLSFYATVFAISWGGILIAVGGPGGIPATAEQVDPQSAQFVLVMLAWFAGPSLGSMLLTALVYGRAGFRDLFARITRWRVGARWYAVGLLSAPLLYLAVSLLLSLISPKFLPGIVTASDKAGLVLMGIGYGLVGGGFLEELGWTGFAVPQLRRRRSALAVGLIVGILWGAYHFSVIFWAGGPLSDLLSVVLLPVQLFAWLPAFRVLMVWVYDRSGGSLLVAMLMHATLSAGMLILQPAALAGVDLLIWLLAWAAALWAVVATVAIVNRRQLSRQPLRRRMA